MAPNLAASQHALMITGKALTYLQIAEVAGCSTGAVKAISADLRRFGSTTAPPNHGGRSRSMTPPMLDALREHLLEKPVLWDEFEV